MISIEEACRIALTKIPENKKIIEVLETDLFWVFVDETFEKLLVTLTRLPSAAPCAPLPLIEKFEKPSLPSD